MRFDLGNILFFNPYIFTDTNEEAPHFALVLLGTQDTGFTAQVFCAVISSKHPTARERWCLALPASRYTWFSTDSFCYVDRRDLQPLAYLGDKPQPRGSLTAEDMRKAGMLIMRCVVQTGQGGELLGAALLRRWHMVVHGT
ncbi:MAG: hypothetical protein IH851_03540 [Armatimonadetes bacterium]|nr:hypothetical protein [Armatimonadota bacterium]